MTDDRRVSDTEARRLWQRAADLQAEAARTLEERSKGIARRDEPEEAPGAGYSLTHVRQAAIEAGISSEFVDLALHETTHEGAAGGEEERGLTQRAMGDGPRWLTASRVYEHPGPVIYESMQRVLPRLRLNLVDTPGGDPMDGGWLHFELPHAALQGERVMMDLRHWAEIRELHMRLVPLGDERCQVTVRASLEHSRRLGGRVLLGAAPLGGLALALIVGAIVSSLTGGAALPVFGAAAGAFGVGTGGSLKGLRSLSRMGWKKGEAALERLLASLAIDARTGGAFQPAPPSASVLRIPGVTE